MSLRHVHSIVDASRINAKILIVEDETSLARTLRDRLQKEGYAVTVSRAGDSGMDVATHEQFDLLILDLMRNCRERYGDIEACR